MALIKCPECQREISERAAACPYCGHPIAATKADKAKGRQAASQFGCAFVILLLIGFVLVMANVGEKAKYTNPSCISDWRKCSDNADLVNHYNAIGIAQGDCEREANNRARYGSPKWPSLDYFGSFYTGDRYPKTGIAVLVEK